MASKKKSGHIYYSEWRKMYTKYKQEYRHQEKVHAAHGYQMADTEGQLTLAQFRAAYTAKKNDNAAAIAAGTRKGQGNIYQQIVSKQRWETSKGQAAATKKALDMMRQEAKAYEQAVESGEIAPKDNPYASPASYKASLEDIRAGKAPEEFWDLIKNNYHSIKSSIGSKKAKKYISQTFFGSN